MVFRPGTPEARAFAAPAIAGFRPGYGYRIQLGNLPEQPGRVLSPSFEVLDTLHIPPGLKAEDFPATVVFSEDDLRRAASGGMVTKVVYLEDPFQAPAVRSTPTQPVEFDVMPGHDPLAEARIRGRAMMIVRLGERDVPAGRVARHRHSRHGPGSRRPGACRRRLVPPTLPAPHWQWFDPILGPKKPLEEILPDGGDIGPRVGIDPEGKLGGLNPTDTAAEYRYGNSPRRVTISNRVCLFSPRFAVLRQESQPVAEGGHRAAGRRRDGPGRGRPASTVSGRTKSGIRSPPAVIVSKLGVRGTQSRIGLAAVERVRGIGGNRHRRRRAAEGRRWSRSRRRRR